MKKLIAASALLILLMSLASFDPVNQAKGAFASTAPKGAHPNTVGLNLGNEAPDFSLRNPMGNVVKLSSLRGKMVLIDFWASWCGPCRHENPTVVKAYNQYKDKKMKGAGNGFTIFSVSLDSDANAWKKAIEKDGLVWAWHGSELAGWNSQVAALYNVEGIPTNYLINDQGIIINKNLRGEDLINYLEKLTKDK